MAKAHIDRTTTLSPVVKVAAIHAHGKQEAAAAHLRKDKGNFSRDVDAERLTMAQLRELGPAFLAKFGEELVKEYGALQDPKARIRQVIREVRERMNEIEQFVDVA